MVTKICIHIIIILYMCTTWGMPKWKEGNVSCLNSTDHLHLFAWSHALSFMCFWRIYMFCLYVYTYLYRIATSHNTHSNLPLPPWPPPQASTKGNRSKWWDVAWAPGKFIVSCFNIYLTYFSFCFRYYIYDNDVMAPPLDNGTTTPMTNGDNDND